MSKIACLCPTAWRPWLLANAIGCFEAQDYPCELRRLFILDDSGECDAQAGPTWELHTMPGPAESLPAKYNRLLAMAISWGAEVIAVWEDDDIYFPWHLNAAMHAMGREHATWAHPSRVWSLYTGRLEQEVAAGRFHAALVFASRTLKSLGGWPLTRRGDFDQSLMALTRARLGPPADPCHHSQPSYVFRWASTASPHAQAQMRSPDDNTWYARAWHAAREAYRRSGWPGGRVTPVMDMETIAVLAAVQSRGSMQAIQPIDGRGQVARLALLRIATARLNLPKDDYCET